MKEAIKDYMITSSNLIMKSLTLTDKIHDVIRMMQKCLKSGSKIIVFGNGATAHPSAYFTNNAQGPLSGIVSLVADGNVLYISPLQLFGTGQTQVNLEWKTPIVSKLVDHQVKAVAEFYGQSVETSTTSVTTFPATDTMTISNLSPLETISANNKTVAEPTVLYSSYKNDGATRFKVSAADGTCVIGGDEKCLITRSTIGLPGSMKSITLGDQVYRIRYTGPESSLERFSITSIDPILGQWKVELESQSGLVPQAHAANDVFLKVKYRDFDTSRITITSK